MCQVETKGFATSPLPTEGSTVTRDKDQLHYSSTNIPVNDFVISFNWTPTTNNQSVPVLFGNGTAADQLVMYWSSTTNLKFRKKLSSVNYDADVTQAYSLDTTYSIKARISSVNGVDVWIDDTKGTGDTNTDDIIKTSNFVIGAFYDNTLQQTGGIDNFTVHSGNFTDADVVELP